jgi:hypothetical protein
LSEANNVSTGVISMAPATLSGLGNFDASTGQTRRQAELTTDKNPAFAAVRAEKAVLTMFAAESAIFVTLDIVLFPSFVRRPRSIATTFFTTLKNSKISRSLISQYQETTANLRKRERRRLPNSRLECRLD